MLSQRVAAALKHIVSEEITAGGYLYVRHGIHAFIRIPESVIITAHHASAHLTAGIRLLFRPIGRLKITGTCKSVIMIILIDILLRSRMLPLIRVKHPWPECIAAPQGNHAVRRSSAAPSGTGIENRGQTALRSQFFQAEHIFIALIASKHPFICDHCRHFPGGGRVHILIVNLHPDDRSAVLKELPLRLSGNLGIQLPNMCQEAVI